MGGLGKGREPRELTTVGKKPVTCTQSSRQTPQNQKVKPHNARVQGTPMCRAEGSLVYSVATGIIVYLHVSGERVQWCTFRNPVGIV